MQELDELRDYINRNAEAIHPKGVYYMSQYMDAIEQAVADRYMELPLDADGVPIRAGDTLVVKDGGYGIEDAALYLASNGYWAIAGRRPDEFTHPRPRTVEDVLRELVALAEDTSGGRLDDGDIEGFAEEIRRLVRDA